jgi:hypothetical protein
VIQETSYSFVSDQATILRRRATNQFRGTNLQFRSPPHSLLINGMIIVDHNPDSSDDNRAMA